MTPITRKLARLRDAWRTHRATLPWDELEAEAARQGCSAADIFFDRAGRAALHPINQGSDDRSRPALVDASVHGRAPR